jgi:hypothetical protein
MSNAYVYRMRELATGKWYVGVHSGINSEYICSSKIVLPLYKANPTGWDRKILRYGNIEDMWALEETILRRLNAIKNPKSYNGNIGGKHFRTTHGHQGKKHSDNTKAKISSSLKGNKNASGIIITPEHRAKISAARKARPTIKISTPAGVFPNAKEAAEHYKVTTTSIRNWCKTNPEFFYVA